MTVHVCIQFDFGGRKPVTARCVAGEITFADFILCMKATP